MVKLGPRTLCNHNNNELESGRAVGMSNATSLASRCKCFLFVSWYKTGISQVVAGSLIYFRLLQGAHSVQQKAHEGHRGRLKIGYTCSSTMQASVGKVIRENAMHTTFCTGAQRFLTRTSLLFY